MFCVSCWLLNLMTFNNTNCHPWISQDYLQKTVLQESITPGDWQCCGLAHCLSWSSTSSWDSELKLLTMIVDSLAPLFISLGFCSVYFEALPSKVQYWGLICFPNAWSPHSSWLPKCHSWPHVIFFALKSVLPDIDIAIYAY